MIDEGEAVHRRRWIKGTVRPVFWQGKVVGSIREWSDTLTIFMLRKLRPDVYGDDSSLNGTMTPNEYAEQCRAAIEEMKAVSRVPKDKYVEHTPHEIPPGER